MQLNSIILIFQILGLLISRKYKKYAHKFKSAFKSTVVEIYFELCLCFCITVRSMDADFFNDLSVGDYFSLILCFLSSLIILGVPAYLVFFFEDIKHGVEETDANLLLETNLTPESNRKHLIYPILFFVRRLAFVVLGVYKTKQDSSDSYLQISVLMFIQLYVNMIIIQFRPFASR